MPQEYLKLAVDLGQLVLVLGGVLWSVAKQAVAFRAITTMVQDHEQRIAALETTTTKAARRRRK